MPSQRVHSHASCVGQSGCAQPNTYVSMILQAVKKTPQARNLSPSIQAVRAPSSSCRAATTVSGLCVVPAMLAVLCSCQPSSFCAHCINGSNVCEATAGVGMDC